MSARFANVASITTATTADTTNFTDATYLALQGGASAQMLSVKRIQGGGLATSTAVVQMEVAYDSTVGATLSGALNGANAGPNAAVLTNPPTGFTTATTKPQRSSNAAHKPLQFGFNAYGGAFIWTAIDAQEQIMIVGNAASAGEISVSSISGAAAMGINIVYEAL